MKLVHQQNPSRFYILKANPNHTRAHSDGVICGYCTSQNIRAGNEDYCEQLDFQEEEDAIM